MSTRLREGVWWIDATGVNAYLLEHEGTLSLIDTGTPLDARRVRTAIANAGFGIDDLDRLLLTHYDLDHVGSLGRLPTDVGIYIGREDAPYLIGEKRPPWRSIKGITQRATEPFVPTVPEERLTPVSDGERIGGFVAYHTPGHTPGHTVYVHEANSVAFLGDLVIELNGEVRPPPWFLSYEPGQLRRSIRAFSSRSPPFEAAAMGHGTPFPRNGDRLLTALARSF